MPITIDLADLIEFGKNLIRPVRDYTGFRLKFAVYC